MQKGTLCTVDIGGEDFPLVNKNKQSKLQAQIHQVQSLPLTFPSDFPQGLQTLFLCSDDCLIVSECSMSFEMRLSEESVERRANRAEVAWPGAEAHDICDSKRNMYDFLEFCNL